MMEQNKKRVLFITSRLPYPMNDGRSATLAQYLDAMSNEYEVGIISLECKKDINIQPAYLSFCEMLKNPHFFKKILNVFFVSLIKKWPLQVAGIYSRKSQKIINRKIIDFKPDYIVCDMIRTARYVTKSKYKGYKILDMDDVLSNRYKTSLNTKEDPLGQFKDMLPSFFLKLIGVLKLNRFILKFESKRIAKKECTLPLKFDRVVLVSSLEKKALSEKVKTNNIITWPVGIKMCNTFKSDYNRNMICFLGNMDASQNQSTLFYILDNIMPLLENKYSFVVVGKCKEQVKQMYENYKNIIFTGFVDSVIPYVQNSLCLLAPIQYGSGIKIKVLEAMSYQVPVITSNIGIEGLDVVKNMDLYVASTPKEYADFIIKLHDDDSLRQTIALNGYDYVKNNNEYELCNEIIINSLKGIDMI